MISKCIPPDSKGEGKPDGYIVNGYGEVYMEPHEYAPVVRQPVLQRSLKY